MSKKTPKKQSAPSPPKREENPPVPDDELLMDYEDSFAIIDETEFAGKAEKTGPSAPQTPEPPADASASDGGENAQSEPFEPEPTIELGEPLPLDDEEAVVDREAVVDLAEVAEQVPPAETGEPPSAPLEPVEPVDETVELSEPVPASASEAEEDEEPTIELTETVAPESDGDETLELGEPAPVDSAASAPEEAPAEAPYALSKEEAAALVAEPAGDMESPEVPAMEPVPDADIPEAQGVSEFPDIPASASDDRQSEPDEAAEATVALDNLPDTVSPPPEEEPEAFEAAEATVALDNLPDEASQAQKDGYSPEAEVSQAFRMLDEPEDPAGPAQSEPESEAEDDDDEVLDLSQNDIVSLSAPTEIGSMEAEESEAAIDPNAKTRTSAISPESEQEELVEQTIAMPLDTDESEAQTVHEPLAGSPVPPQSPSEADDSQMDFFDESEEAVEETLSLSYYDTDARTVTAPLARPADSQPAPSETETSEEATEAVFSLADEAAEPTIGLLDETQQLHQPDIELQEEADESDTGMLRNAVTEKSRIEGETAASPADEAVSVSGDSDPHPSDTARIQEAATEKAQIKGSPLSPPVWQDSGESVDIMGVEVVEDDGVLTEVDKGLMALLQDDLELMELEKQTARQRESESGDEWEGAAGEDESGQLSDEALLLELREQAAHTDGDISDQSQEVDTGAEGISVTQLDATLERLIERILSEKLEGKITDAIKQALAEGLKQFKDDLYVDEMIDGE